MPDDPCFQILLSAEVIHYLPGHSVLHQGIYGEVPPSGSFPSAYEGIHVYHEISVAFSHGALASGHGNIDVLAPESKNTETLTVCQRLTYLFKY